LADRLQTNQSFIGEEADDQTPQILEESVRKVSPAVDLRERRPGRFNGCHFRLDWGDLNTRAVGAMGREISRAEDWQKVLVDRINGSPARSEILRTSKNL
jgi:hypothetical protein